MDLDEVIMPSPIEFPPVNGLGWRVLFFSFTTKHPFIFVPSTSPRMADAYFQFDTVSNINFIPLFLLKMLS